MGFADHHHRPNLPLPLLLLLRLPLSLFSFLIEGAYDEITIISVLPWLSHLLFVDAPFFDSLYRIAFFIIVGVMGWCLLRFVRCHEC